MPDAPSSSSFPADAFRSDFPGGRAAGRLEVRASELRFVPASAGPEIALPLAGIALRVSGIQHEVLLFSHPGQPGTEISTTARALLDHPSLRTQPAVARQLTAAQKRHARGRLVLPGCIVLPLLLLTLLWLLKDPIVGWIAARVPVSVETKVGEVLFTAVAAQTPLITHSDLDRQLDELVAPLLVAVPNPGYRFNFHLAADPALNAFALPGGNVVVHSGLVLAAETPEELLGVLAHEIAHVTRRHSLRQIISSAGMLVVFQALFGDFTGLAAVVADGGYRLLTLEHSRRQELDADDTGWDYLVAARIDPRGLGRFFARLEAEMAGTAAAKLDTTLSFLSTHPMSSERRERLEKRWREIEATSRFDPVSFDLAAFQQALRTALPESPSSRSEPR